jgi:tetratricopeptide (TPR) repeat protein
MHPLSQSIMAPTSSSTLIFRLACWLMAALAFGQVMIAGVALAIRMESSKTVQYVEKSISTQPQVAINRPIESASTKESHATPVPRGPQPEATPVSPNPPASGIVETNPLPPPRPLISPEISDPLAERLIHEAKAARVSEDMMTAITKLDQALQTSPKDAHVLYELGLCHEAMGIYDKARQYYHQVYQLGTTTAGELYVQAADKLRSGFEQPLDKVHRVVLGRPRVFKDPNREKGEKVIITIPVQTVPGEAIEGRDLEVIVNFFDEVGARKDINPADTTNSQVESKWTTEPLDWTTGEELLQITYTLPPQDPQQEHLFGEKRYYGQVVELSYKGELIDAQAWPRILAHKLNKPNASPVFLDREMPPGFNPDNPLLPNAPEDDSSFDASPDHSQTNLSNPSSDPVGDDPTLLPVPPEYQNLPQP